MRPPRASTTHPRVPGAAPVAKTHRVLLAAILVAVGGGLLSAAPATAAHAASPYYSYARTFEGGTWQLGLPPDVTQVTVYVTGAGGSGGGGAQHRAGGGGGGGGTVRCTLGVTPYTGLTIVVGHLGDYGYQWGPTGEDSKVAVGQDVWAIGYGGKGGAPAAQWGGGAGGAAGDCPGGSDTESWAGSAGDRTPGYGHGGPGGYPSGAHSGCRYTNAGRGGTGGAADDLRGYLGKPGAFGCVVVEFESLYNMG